MNLSDVQVFCKVAQTNSFTTAARQLGMTRSAVSRKMSRLERHLGVTLLHRTTRSVALTEAGRKFFEHCDKIEGILHAAAAAVTGADQQAIGSVTCTLPTCLGAALMPGIVQRFGPAYPDVHLNLQFAEKNLDLITGGFDAAIRVSRRLEDSRLLSKCITTTSQVIVASPRYLATHGIPRTPDDLKNHRCLVVGGAVSQRVVWPFVVAQSEVDIPIQPHFTSNTGLALILAACMDFGLLCVPELLVCGEIAQGRLQVVLQDYCATEPYSVYALYPTRKPPAKVRAFVDFVEAEIPNLPTIDRWVPLARPKTVTIRAAVPAK